MDWGKLKILYIENNPHWHFHVGKALEKIGIKNLETAQNIGQAIELVKRQKFDLVICDLWLKGIGITKSIEMLRKIMPEFRLLLMSADDENVERHKTELNADGVIVKDAGTRGDELVRFWEEDLIGEIEKLFPLK